MKEFKFNMDSFLKNCERAGVAVNKGSSGITMNGTPFNIKKEIINALTDPNVFDIQSDGVSFHISGIDTHNQNKYQSTNVTLIAA